MCASAEERNQLYNSILGEFTSYFAPEAKLIYMRNKPRFIEKNGRRQLGLPDSGDSRFPDLILYEPGRKRLFLIETRRKYGSISKQRYFELERIFCKCKVNKVYLTVFTDFDAYKKSSHNISWGTHVWIASTPSHMIHYDGEKNLEPR